ncbi:fimbrial chaperone [Escherichia coli]|uniref:fimbrial chaperone n=1 Tax=Escherichia coli TaxID=562 RepID=UPI0002CBB21C|nr:fimbrial chaperone [Escherichia coli]EAA1188426.1 fimbrial chaperone [Escherichia coli]EEW9233294.1 fimbrial chaperone [Escherichia coli]EFA6660037.1 fimbrial chaperone [Escherichia coli]EFD3047571.1 fimbrial chaperone [Escherichia coli]EFD3070594.1 fimbrial chaperone [Escherichia coli]
MFFKTKHSLALCFATCLAFSSSAIADIVISGTRVIYTSVQKSVNVRLENKGNNPLLVQSWLDTGDDNAEPGSINVPFTATRIDGKRGQTIKLMYTGSSALPKDRESVFWFNVLEVPPKPDAEKMANQSMLQLAFRTRIKLFYRPEGLTGIPSDAPAALKWSWTTSGGKAALRVVNPTPFYVSFSSGDLVASGKRYPLDVKMIAPLGEDVITVNSLSSKVSSAKVHFFAINDFGGAIEGNATL